MTKKHGRHRENSRTVLRTKVNRTAIVAALFMTVGCTVVGTGTRTVIKAEGGSDYAAKLLPGYVVPEGSRPSRRVAMFKYNVEPSRTSWFWGGDVGVLSAFDRYLESKYGTRKPQTALLSAEIRDLGKVPAFSPTLQAMAAAEVLKIMTEPSASASDKLAQKDLLLSSFLNVPQSNEIKTLNTTKGGCQLYYYYPHIEVDLSADVLSPSLNDRFSELIFLIHVDKMSFVKGVRFVNFLPKDTDIAEFSRGMLKESTIAQVKGTYGLTNSSKATNVSGNQTTESSVSPSLGGEMSLTYTEGLERDLKEAIEKKTTGIVQNGQTFLADLRALRNVRIGGSYRFDLLLEVPGQLEETDEYCWSYPVQKEVRAHVVIVGVVRHVENLGHTGVFQRVPEAENDDVFEEVVLHEIPAEKQILWEYNNIPAVRRRPFSEGTQVAGHQRPDKKASSKPTHK
jgi:hypothetical protein